MTNTAVSSKESRLDYAEGFISRMDPISEMATNQLRNKTVKVVGAVGSIAAELDIYPPEAAIDRLSDKSKKRVRQLLEAVNLGPQVGCKEIDRSTISRIGALTTYLDDQEPIIKHNL